MSKMDLSDGLNYTVKEPNVSWNPEKKQFLCCLFKFFEKDLTAYKAVFDSVYEDDLRTFGFTHGVKESTLNTQWHDLRRSSHFEWGEVHLSPFDKDGRWSPFIAAIRRTLATLRIDLPEKARDDIDTSTFDPTLHTSSQPTSSQIHPQSDADIAGTTEQVDEAIEEVIMNKSEQQPTNDVSTWENTALSKYGGKECFWCVQERVNEARNKPREYTTGKGILEPLLYRWSNVDSQGVNNKNLYIAGLFVDWDKYFSPDMISQEKFDEYFSNHIHRKEVSSPFISTFKSMLAPVHRAVRNQEGAIISIIESKKLGDLVYSARGFCQKHQLRIGRYNGGGEYLIWGKVPSDAIICSFKVSTLKQIADEHDDIAEILQLRTIASYKHNQRSLKDALEKRGGYLDHTSGTIIGKLLSLLQVPFEFSGEVGIGMYYSWRLRKRGGPGKAFQEGLNACYGLPAETPITSHDQEQEVYVISDDESLTEDGASEDEEARVQDPSSVEQHNFAAVAPSANRAHGDNNDIVHLENDTDKYLTYTSHQSGQNETRRFSTSHSQNDQGIDDNDEFRVQDNSEVLLLASSCMSDNEQSVDEDDDYYGAVDLIPKWPSQSLRSLPNIETYDDYTGRWILQQDEISLQVAAHSSSEASRERLKINHVGSSDSADSGGYISLPILEGSDLDSSSSIIAAMCEDMELDTENAMKESKVASEIDCQYVFGQDRARRRLIWG